MASVSKRSWSWVAMARLHSTEEPVCLDHTICLRYTDKHGGDGAHRPAGGRAGLAADRRSDPRRAGAGGHAARCPAGYGARIGGGSRGEPQHGGGSLPPARSGGFPQAPARRGRGGVGARGAAGCRGRAGALRAQAAAAGGRGARSGSAGGRAAVRAAARIRGRVMVDIREPSLEPEAGGLPGGAAMQAGPFALLAAGALWLWTRWSRLPDRLPAHWNWRGDPDRFVSRTALSLSMPLLIGAAVCLLLLAMQIGIRHGAARAPLRKPSLRILLAAEYLSAVACCGTLAAMATSGRMLTPLLVVCGAGAAGLFVATLAAALNSPRAHARNPAAWHAGF